jgi:hypothetical protein
MHQSALPERSNPKWNLSPAVIAVVPQPSLIRRLRTGSQAARQRQRQHNSHLEMKSFAHHSRLPVHSFAATPFYHSGATIEQSGRSFLTSVSGSSIVVEAGATSP